MSYPGPPSGLKTWSTTASETVSVPILRNDVTGNVWFFSSPPLYFGQLQSLWAIPASAYYYVPLDTDLADPLGLHPDTSLPENIYLPYLGTYLCIGFMSYDSAVSGLYDAAIGVVQNGVATPFVGQQTPPQTGLRPFELAVELQTFNPATFDTVSLAGFQDAVGTVNTYVHAGQYSTLNVLWAAAAAPPPGWPGTSIPVPANVPFSDTTEITGTFLNTNVRDTVNFLQYPPAARIVRTGNTQLASTTFPAGTAVPFQASTIDTFAGFSVGSPTRYTFQKAGLYFVWGQVNFANDTTGTDRACGLRVTGGTIQWGSTEAAINDSLGHVSIACQMVRVSAADYIEVIGHGDLMQAALAAAGGSGDPAKAKSNGKTKVAA